MKWFLTYCFFHNICFLIISLHFLFFLMYLSVTRMSSFRKQSCILFTRFLKWFFVVALFWDEVSLDSPSCPQPHNLLPWDVQHWDCRCAWPSLEYCWVFGVSYLFWTLILRWSNGLQMFLFILFLCSSVSFAP